MRPSKTYQALVADKKNQDKTDLEIRQLSTDNLPEHDVLVNVHYSSLNYKDALSARGYPGVTKNYPHTPGIDASGIVEHSSDKRFREGDEVIVTSYDLGQNTPGGFGEYISVPGDWIVPLPDGLSLKESMIIGTAGFTAAYGVKKIIDYNIGPADGDILVTGASGGVGSMAVNILSKLGYSVIAVTGKDSAKNFLRSIGAADVASRDEIYSDSSKPLLSSRWIGAVDTVGGEMLDAVIRQTAHNGLVTCCGNVLGGELTTSIYPFILRGIGLMGIDSGICLMKDRIKIWDLLSSDWKPEKLEIIHKEITIDSLPGEIEAILKGKQTGRILVKAPY